MPVAVTMARATTKYFTTKLAYRYWKWRFIVNMFELAMNPGEGIPCFKLIFNFSKLKEFSFVAKNRSKVPDMVECVL